ncbi:MAG: oligosaccharide flippase family protein [Balneolales bacterium]
MKKKLFSKDTFTGQVAILSSGSMAAQAIPLLLTPLLTRLYTPEQFGLLALFTSISVVFAILAAGKYEIAIVIPKKNQSALNLLALSLTLALITLLFWVVIFIPFNTQIAGFINNPDLSFWLYLMPLAILAIIVYEIFFSWLNRTSDYKELSYGKVLHSGSMTVIQTFLGFLGFGTGGLIIGDLIGRINGAIYYGWKTVTGNLFDRNLISKKEIKKEASIHQDFPKYTMGSTLIARIGEEAPIIMITTFFEAAFVGFFAIATRIMRMPMALLGQAITRVFFRKVSENYNNKIKSRNLIVKMWLILAAIGLPPTLIVFIFGGNLFQFVLGPEWFEAGVMAAYLTPMILAEFISTPTSMGYIVYKRQDLSPWFALSVVIYRPLALYIGYLREDIYLGIALLVFTHIFQIILYNLIIYRIMKKQEENFQDQSLV